MSIDEVMPLVISLEVEANCYDEDDNASIDAVKRARVALCSAIEQHVAEAVARERKDCAKACEDVGTTRWDEYAASYNSAVFDCAAAVRARGTT